MTIGFVVWNPFQVFHMGPIADYLDDPMFVVINRGDRQELRDAFGGSVSSFIDLPHQIVSERQLVGLDGELDALLCPNPFPGMNALVSTRRIGIQYSMTKESYQYGTWRSQFDLNLAYGDYTAQKLLQYGPAVAVGNPRFTPWFKRQPDSGPTGAAPARGRRPTILYLPTWGEFSSVPRFLSAIEVLQDEYDVISKLHHKSYLTEPDKTDQLATSSLDRSLSSKDDLLPLLDDADIIISDFSGAIFDGIYVRKPVILLQDEPERLIGKKFTFDSIEYARRDDIGPVVSSPDRLRETVAGVLDGSIDFRDRNEALRAECFSEDVDAAERCAEVLAAVAKHRRNPISPRSRSTRPILARPHPLEARIDRLERTIERQAAPGPSWSQKRKRFDARRRAREAVKSTAIALHGPQVATRLTAAAPGGSAEAVRSRLEGYSLRLEPEIELAVDVLEARQRQGRLTVAERLWLADLHATRGLVDQAVQTLDELPPDHGLDPEPIQLLTKAYRSLSGPTATWNAQLGLSAVQVSPAASNRQLAGEQPEAIEVLRRVINHAASTASAHGDFDLASDLYVASLEIDDDHPVVHYRHAIALEAAFRFDEAHDAFADAVRRSPLTPNYRRATSRLASKFENWDRARATALRGAPSLAVEVSRQLPAGRAPLAPLDLVDRAFAEPEISREPAFAEAIERSRAMAGSRPLEYWVALHWRLIRAGTFTAAYGVKDLAALSVLDDLAQSSKNDARSTVMLARALLTLGRVDEARELLTLRLAIARDRSEVMVAKGLADVAFFAGDLAPAAGWYAERPEPLFPQDEARTRARELFRGRRVAVVGPGARPDGDDPPSSLRDAYDVIVRTNLAAQATPMPDGSPVADVVYFNSGITQLGVAGLLSVSADQGVRQVVLRRPKELHSLVPRIASGEVRLTEVEPGCHLHSSSFGVQRIVYDVALHEPASIDVLNIDFFTGATEYAPGYKVENADVSFRGYSHDFRGDFVISQNLASSGAVRFDAVATAILESSVDDYLAVLDAKESDG